MRETVEALRNGFKKGKMQSVEAVSYTHLDVYKRQDYDRTIRRLLLGVTLFIAIATAMVGPISFLG